MRFVQPSSTVVNSRNRLKNLRSAALVSALGARYPHRSVGLASALGASSASAGLRVVDLLPNMFPVAQSAFVAPAWRKYLAAEVAATAETRTALARTRLVSELFPQTRFEVSSVSADTPANWAARAVYAVSKSVLLSRNGYNAAMLASAPVAGELVVPTALGKGELAPTSFVGRHDLRRFLAQTAHRLPVTLPRFGVRLGLDGVRLGAPHMQHSSPHLIAQARGLEGYGQAIGVSATTGRMFSALHRMRKFNTPANMKRFIINLRHAKGPTRTGFSAIMRVRTPEERHLAETLVWNMKGRGRSSVRGFGSLTAREVASMFNSIRRVGSPLLLKRIRRTFKALRRNIRNKKWIARGRGFVKSRWASGFSPYRLRQHLVNRGKHAGGSRRMYKGPGFLRVQAFHWRRTRQSRLHFVYSHPYFKKRHRDYVRREEPRAGHADHEYRRQARSRLFYGAQVGAFSAGALSMAVRPTSIHTPHNRKIRNFAMRRAIQTFRRFRKRFSVRRLGLGAANWRTYAVMRARRARRNAKLRRGRQRQRFKRFKRISAYGFRLPNFVQQRAIRKKALNLRAVSGLASAGTPEFRLLQAAKSDKMRQFIRTNVLLANKHFGLAGNCSGYMASRHLFRTFFNSNLRSTWTQFEAPAPLRGMNGQLLESEAALRTTLKRYARPQVAVVRGGESVLQTLHARFSRYRTAAVNLLKRRGRRAVKLADRVLFERVKKLNPLTRRLRPVLSKKVLAGDIYAAGQTREAAVRRYVPVQTFKHSYRIALRAAPHHRAGYLNPPERLEDVRRNAALAAVVAARHSQTEAALVPGAFANASQISSLAVASPLYGVRNSAAGYKLRSAEIYPALDLTRPGMVLTPAMHRAMQVVHDEIKDDINPLSRVAIPGGDMFRDTAALRRLTPGAKLRSHVVYGPARIHRVINLQEQIDATAERMLQRAYKKHKRAGNFKVKLSPKKFYKAARRICEKRYTSGLYVKNARAMAAKIGKFEAEAYRLDRAKTIGFGRASLEKSRFTAKLYGTRCTAKGPVYGTPRTMGKPTGRSMEILSEATRFTKEDGPAGLVMHAAGKTHPRRYTLAKPRRNLSAKAVSAAVAKTLRSLAVRLDLVPVVDFGLLSRQLYSAGYNQGFRSVVGLRFARARMKTIVKSRAYPALNSLRAVRSDEFISGLGETKLGLVKLFERMRTSRFGRKSIRRALFRFAQHSKKARTHRVAAIRRVLRSAEALDKLLVRLNNPEASLLPLEIVSASDIVVAYTAPMPADRPQFAAAQWFKQITRGSESVSTFGFSATYLPTVLLVDTFNH